MNVRVSHRLIRRSLHQRSGPGDYQRVRWKLIPTVRPLSNTSSAERAPAGVNRAQASDW